MAVNDTSDDGGRGRDDVRELAHPQCPAVRHRQGPDLLETVGHHHGVAGQHRRGQDRATQPTRHRISPVAVVRSETSPSRSTSAMTSPSETGANRPRSARRSVQASSRPSTAVGYGVGAVRAETLGGARHGLGADRLGLAPLGVPVGRGAVELDELLGEVLAGGLDPVAGLHGAVAGAGPLLEDLLRAGGSSSTSSDRGPCSRSARSPRRCVRPTSTSTTSVSSVVEE